MLPNYRLAVWLSGNALASINVVALRQSRLVLGWVTLWTGKPSRYVTNQLGRLSLLPSNEPGELSQWLCHDDSTTNIVLVIIIIIIIITQWQTTMVTMIDCWYTHRTVPTDYWAVLFRIFMVIGVCFVMPCYSAT